MNSFEFCNPTHIIFGENAINKLATSISKFGPNVLLAYGGGSIKKNGIYNDVIEQLEKAEKTIFELSGIMSNPRTSKVDEGIAICKKHNIDFILAVGGGSTIDCCKAIAAATLLPEDVNYWDFLFVKRQPSPKAIPLGTVLTMAATGSEMNCGAVISNWDIQKKLSMRSPNVFPQFSILDPTYTYTLPKQQMVYGIVDMISHLLESYFSTPDTPNVTDDLIESLLKTIIKNAEIALINQENYIARSNLMWSATLALNGLTTLGKKMDWMTHQIEHALSAYYDIPHGAGLAICHPMLLKYIYKNHLPRFVQFAKNVWNISKENKTDDEIALEGIVALRQFFHKIGAPITLAEVEIPEDKLEEIANSANIFPTLYHNFTAEDILLIYRSALK